jgi:hypothetical protein
MDTSDDELLLGEDLELNDRLIGSRFLTKEAAIE